MPRSQTLLFQLSGCGLLQRTLPQGFQQRSRLSQKNAAVNKNDKQRRHDYFWEYKSLAFFMESFSSITSQSRIMGFARGCWTRTTSFFFKSKYTCEPKRLSSQFLLLAQTQIHLRCQKAAVCWLPFVADCAVTTRELLSWQVTHSTLRRGI